MHTYTIDAANADLHQGGMLCGYRGEPANRTGGFYVRPAKIQKGDVHKGHAHYIDHIGNLVSGKAAVLWCREDGSDSGIVWVLKPAKLLVLRDVWHAIYAIEDCEWECWFSASEADAMADEEAKGSFFLERPTRSAEADRIIESLIAKMRGGELCVNS